MRPCIAVLLASFASFVFADVSPLSVRGNQVLAGGQPASFAGNSLFWSNTGWGGEKFYNANVVRWLKTDWNSKIVRVAMGVEDANGYLQDPAGNKARVKAVVDAAIANDMYVIIDWHSHKAENYRPQAIAFFEEMARTYGKSNHVLYEIYNEPLQVSWSNTIKPYAQAVVNAIRAIDPDNLIIVGTPSWSQDVDVASRDKLSGTNIAYALHFYAGSHGQQLRDKAQTALNNGVALFVTEWGSVSANGDGAVAEAETMAWVKFMKDKGISNANWALNDKAEGASALVPGASSQGSWSNTQLTRSGTLAKQIISTWPGNGSGACSRVSVPARIQAEAFCQMSGVQIEPTTDADGGSNIGYIDNGDWMTYDIEVPAAGRYKIGYRVASASGGGRIQFEKGGGGAIYGMLDFPGTGDWQRWATVSHEVTLPAGQQTVAVRANQGGFNLNWLEISRVDQGDSGGSQPGGSSSSSSSSAASSSTNNGSGSNSSSGVAQSSDTLPAGLYTIINAGSGLCVDLAGASNAEGGNIQQARCNSSNAQVFEVTQPSAGVLTLKNLASGKLMDVASASTADGANIQQWSSNNTNAQRFRATRSQGNRYALVNVGSNKCVDITAASTSDGANVQQYACNGSAAQQFLFYPWNASKRGALPVGRYSIGSQHSKRCLSNAGGSNADGTRIVQTNCSATATQRFDVLPETTGAYRFINVGSGKSLDIADISTANGALLTQWAATQGDNQHFVVDVADGGYRILARHSQRCLDLKDWSTNEGGLVQQWSCASQANQRWSFTPAETSATPNPAPPTNGWKLVWQDEFDGSAVDTQKWNFEVNGGGGGNNELQYYTQRPQNVSVANGVLSIHALAERYCSTDGCRDYTSARLTTRNKGDWLYGRMEVRAKLPGGQGLWPAIWMLPTDWAYGGWAASGEIDIMEAVNPGAAGGNTVHGTLHFGGAWPNNTSKGQSTIPASSIVDNFHVYAVEWEERQIRFYVDGVLYHTATEWWSSGGAFPAPFNQRFHMLLNVAVGGNWPGSPNASTRFPQRMDVDYVRVYQK